MKKIKTLAAACIARLWPVAIMAVNMSVCIIAFLLVLADVACEPASHDVPPTAMVASFEERGR